MNILEAIYNWEIQQRGTSLTTFKKAIKNLDIDYSIPVHTIKYIYNVGNERYRQDKCWIELNVDGLSYYRITCNYNVIMKLIHDHKTQVYLLPRRKYFELTLGED